MGIVLTHRGRRAHRVKEGLFRAELVGEDDHDFITDVFVDDAWASVQCLSRDPREEVLDVDERRGRAQVECAGGEAANIRKEYCCLDLTSLNREREAPSIVQGAV